MFYNILLLFLLNWKEILSNFVLMKTQLFPRLHEFWSKNIWPVGNLPTYVWLTDIWNLADRHLSKRHMAKRQLAKRAVLFANKFLLMICRPNVCRTNGFRPKDVEPVASILMKIFENFFVRIFFFSEETFTKSSFVKFVQFVKFVKFVKYVLFCAKNLNCLMKKQKANSAVVEQSTCEPKSKGSILAATGTGRR